MLRLHAKSRAPAINLAALSVNRAVQKIAGIELEARLRGQHLEHAA